MAPKKDPLAEVEKLTGDLEAIQLRRDLAMLQAKAAGKPAQAIADAAKISPATFYRVVGIHRDQFADPARYRRYAPSLVLDQPDEGLTVAIGVNPDQSPLATFTFDERHPVLLLLQDDDREALAAVDVWPVIAASVAASDARVGVYGRSPVGVRSWDLPTYLGVYGELENHAEAPLNLLYEFESRIERIADGEDVPPALMLIQGYSKAVEVINTALAYGHQARMYMIVEDRRWHPRWSVISSTLAVGGSVGGGWASLITAAGRGPTMPARFGTAMLTCPEGTAEILLPVQQGHSALPAGQPTPLASTTSSP